MVPWDRATALLISAMMDAHPLLCLCAGWGVPLPFKPPPHLPIGGQSCMVRSTLRQLERQCIKHVRSLVWQILGRDRCAGPNASPRYEPGVQHRRHYLDLIYRFLHICCTIESIFILYTKEPFNVRSLIWITLPLIMSLSQTLETPQTGKYEQPTGLWVISSTVPSLLAYIYLSFGRAARQLPPFPTPPRHVPRHPLEILG